MHLCSTAVNTLSVIHAAGARKSLYKLYSYIILYYFFSLRSIATALVLLKILSIRNNISNFLYIVMSVYYSFSPGSVFCAAAGTVSASAAGISCAALHAEYVGHV